jgi:hypothetical protein
MGICSAFWRENKINGGNYPFYDRHRGPARYFVRFCFIRSPRPRLGKPGMAWALWMDESPNPGKNEEPGDATGPNNAVQMEKRAARGLVGETAGDALTHGCYVQVRLRTITSTE